jgi:uncharacterized protein (TIGR04222 family)
MDFLFDNPLASMYGPYFLIFYSVFNIITLTVFSVLKNGLDKTDQLAIPPIPSSPDPYEIAYLRGGENELARAVVFSLTQKNLLKIINDGKTARFYKTEADFDGRGLLPIEQIVLGWFGMTRDAHEIFHSNGLTQTLCAYYETYQARLEQQQLVPDDEIKRRRNKLQITTALVIAGLGLYKLAAAILNGFTNVWGLIIIGAIGVFLIAVFGKLPRQTKLGKKHLERLQIAFDRLKNTSQFININQPGNSQPTFASVDPLLLSVGVFGGTVLAGTMYDDYNHAFQKAHNTGSSCGSGCGSSSDSSGGSDGGGGGCSSGGCGGCGGGCGG